MNYENVELRMSLRKFIIQVVDKITFISIANNSLIEITYKNGVHKHIIIANKKLSEIITEISIQENNGMIYFDSPTFSIVENLTEGTCTFSNIFHAKNQDYFLLAYYLGGLEGKQWIVDIMYSNENMSIVAAN